MKFSASAHSLLILPLFLLCGCQQEDQRAYIFARSGDIHSLQQELSKVDVKAINNMSGNLETSLIHAAAESGQTGSVLALLNAGFEPNLRLKNKLTPLFLAAGNDHSEVVALLLSRGGDASFDLGSDTKAPYSPLCAAAIKGNTKVAEILLKLAPEKLQSRTQALKMAAMRGHLDVVKVIVDSGVLLDSTAGEFAQAAGHSDIAAFLDNASAANTAHQLLAANVDKLSNEMSALLNAKRAGKPFDAQREERLSKELTKMAAALKTSVEDK